MKRVKILILAIVLVLSGTAFFITIPQATSDLTAEEAKTKVINWFKERPITNISVVSVEEKYSVYKVITEFFGDQKTVHVSKDGKYVFSTGFNTSEKPPISTPPTRTCVLKTMFSICDEQEESKNWH